MNVLIDAHALIWAADNPANLSAPASQALQDLHNTLWVSSATLWEISIKVGLGKLQLNRPLRQWIHLTIAHLDASILPIAIEHATSQADLPFYHRDPFDRLLVAQALHENFAVLSSDSILQKYGIQRIW